MNTDRELLKTAFREAILYCETMGLDREDGFEVALERQIAKSPRLTEILYTLTPEMILSIMKELGPEMGLEEADFEPMIIPHEMPRYRWTEDAKWDDFLKTMKENASRTEKKCQFVPFTGDCISYESMNKKQKAWYFYWRTQMRKENPLPNQVPYLLLYGLESLHMVGCSTPVEGVEALMKLFQYYSEEDELLEGFLLGTLFDYCLFHQFPYQPMIAVSDIVPSNPTHVDYLMSVNAKIESTDLFVIPSYFVRFLSDFPLEKTRLHQSDELEGFDLDDSALILLSITGFAIMELHFWLVETEKTGFFDKYASIQEETVSFHIFENIFSLEETDFRVSMRRFTKDQGLRHTVTELVRLTENILREHFGVRGRLRQIDLAPEVQSFVTDAIFQRFEAMEGGESQESQELPNNIIPFPKQ